MDKILSINSCLVKEDVVLVRLVSTRTPLMIKKTTCMDAFPFGAR
jgi:hypothetical protein